jgi:hypothetical protein
MEEIRGVLRHRHGLQPEQEDFVMRALTEITGPQETFPTSSQVLSMLLAAIAVAADR